MIDNNQKPTLSELIDINFLQKFQDLFAEIMGVASITVDDKGPITKPSNFTDFCIKYTRGSEEGYRRCNDFDIQWGKVAAKSGKPTIYQCHSGLVDFAVPIIVDGEHVGSILGGQVLTEKPDENHFRKIAQELGIDEEEYIKALRKIKIIKKKKIEQAVEIMYLAANAISRIGNKNLLLLKKNQREKLYVEVINKIRSSLDLDEILHFICEEVTKIFGVQRAAITVFTDSTDYEKYSMKKEFTISPEIPRFPYNEASVKSAAYWGHYLSTKSKILVLDDIEKADLPDYFRQIYSDMGVKSAIGVSIQKGKDVWGTLVLSDYNKLRHWTDDEINLLLSISDQLYIAINQAELYEKEKNEVERKQSLSKIINIIRSSLDIKEVKDRFVEEVGKYFKADRCFIYEYGDIIPRGVYSEYTSSPDIRKVSEENFDSPEYKFWEAEMFKNNLEEGKFIYDMKQYIIDNKLEQTNIEDNSYRLDIKSAAGIPIFYSDVLYGELIIQYTKEKVNLGDEDRKFLYDLAIQAGIGIHQAEMYEREKIMAERERISRNIVEILRSSIDKAIIKKLFVKNIGKFFNANMVFFSEYDYNKKMYLPVDKDSEYLSGIEEKSIVGYDWSKPEISSFISVLLEKREININNVDEYINNNVHQQDLINLLKWFDVKSVYNFPVLYQNQILGFFSIEFTKNTVKLSEEEIVRLRRLCTQAGIALYHADLYAKAQQYQSSKKSFIADISGKILEPTNNILDSSTLLFRNEFERSIQLRHLDSIISSCNELIELTKNISDD